MIFVACYTIDTPYAEEAAKLRASLEAHGLEHDVEGYESRGSWLANCHYIPIFCRKMLEKHRGQSVVYLDADAVVQRFPALLFQVDHDRKVDFAVHHLPRPDWKPPGELLDGTMYLRDADATRRLLDAWVLLDEAAFPRGVFEQKVLEDLLPKFKIRWQELPPEYCFIFDNKVQTKAAREEPSIVHYQASRRLRKGQPTVLSTAAFLLKQPRPVAVVGNGASLGESGRLIDEHPSVVRLNNFVLDGHEERAGRRTTAWCVNGAKDVPHRELAVPVLTPFGRGGDIYEIAPAWQRVPHLMVPDSAWGRRTREAFKVANPSTGLTLLYMLDVLGVEADAYGFDSFRTGHYWDEDPSWVTHSPGGEAAALRSMAHVTVRS